MAAASSIAEDFDDEFLTCPVCLSLYEEPKLLPCFHTFCRMCIEVLANKSGGRNFQCPLYRSDVKLPCPVRSGGVDKLSSNFYINKLLDFRKLRLSKMSQVQCQMCKSGTQAAAVCGDCTFLLCQNCVSAHRNTTVLQDHAIITLNDLENPTMRSQYARQIYCPRHPGQRTTFYCEPCATLVCIACTVDEHRPGENHDPREVEKVAPKYRASVEGVMKKTEAVVTKINQQVKTLDKELTATTENCDQEKKNIEKHYEDLISKLQKEKQEMITKVDKVKRDRKDELIREKEEITRELHETNEGLAFCQNILDRDNKIELLSLRQQMEERLRQLASQQTGTSNRTLEGHTRVTFQPTSMPQVSGGSLSVFAGFSIDHVQEPAVESLPCSVTVTTNKADLTGGDVAPQIEVTSPQGKTTLIQTIAHTSPPLAAGKGQTSRVRRVWGGEWRPCESEKHTLGVCMGGKKDLGSLTVDVGSNNPVLRFGQKGSQQGQFDTPIDVAVRGDRLYVADNANHHVQVFELTGRFVHSFPTDSPIGLAVQADGTIVVKSWKEVKKLSPSGTLLHNFPLGDYCTDPYGLAVQRDGRVVVADPDKHSIFLFEADGTLVKQVGGKGQGEGQFNEPCFVCVDKEDNIIVADTKNHRVQVFDKNLNFKHKFGQKGRQPQGMWWPTGVSADSRGNIVLANIGGTADGVEQGQKLQVFRPDGNWVSTISSDGDKLNWPHGVAVTEDGHVFVTNTGDHCIRKYRYMAPARRHKPTMAELSPLTRLFVKISDGLSEEDLRNLRAILAREGLGQGKVEQATPHEMFNMPEADNRIGKGNLGFLVQVLRSMKKGKLAEEAERLEQDQRRELQGGKLQDPKEVDKEVAMYKASVEAAISKITQKMVTLNKELIATAENCEQVEKEIQQHYKRLISKLQLEEQEMITRVQRVNRDRGGELTREKEKMEMELRKTKEAEISVQKMLDCKDDSEALVLRQDMEEKVKKLSLQETEDRSLGGPTKVTFQPCSLSQVSGGSFRVRRVWGAEWRPQESGKHTLGVCMGGKKDLGSLTVDVGSNNPVLRFGQMGSQQEQFDRPIDVAVRGDRLYVADTFNHCVQVFDLSGKFCHSFSTSYPVGLAVQTDGTIVVNSGKEVKKFSPSGELLHKFSLGEYCTYPYGLAVQRDGGVVVADPDKHSIFLFEADGTLVKQVGGKGQGEGQFNMPAFVCVDKGDNIIVSDKVNHRVQVFDKNLNFKHKFGQNGRQPQDMIGPNGVSADSRGNIVLADIGDNSEVGGVEHGRKLQVFRADGTWLSTISSDGDKLKEPHGVAVTEDGHVFVADPFDHCIRKYRYM
ncbi:tripartite motif-containing protein 3-like [Branchiostoma lanceolatum]|uniref:tripartite motif-containing protein 3-like n=1 Tax=Branchiostoma lanceolatum TaxID=7740 RepID=UPI0034523393